MSSVPQLGTLERFETSRLCLETGASRTMAQDRHLAVADTGEEYSGAGGVQWL